MLCLFFIFLRVGAPDITEVVVLCIMFEMISTTAVVMEVWILNLSSGVCKC